ncbi:MAG: hypothetical protein HYX68_02870 [Planctomycetes bacterium]|jgi:hypothetical protein|nr:hypothetical protein [Planctomycetota bacterium]
MGNTSFKEWLIEQKRHANPRQVAVKKKEWIDALEKLFAEITAWIREDDSDGIVRITKETTKIDEEEFGTYSAPLLRFDLNNRTVAAIPIARNVLGPAAEIGPLAPIRGEGRVDLKGGGEKIQLYLVRDSQDQRRWVIANQDRLTFRDLDKTAFEESLQSLFS